jgi:hypothetical protein
MTAKNELREEMIRMWQLKGVALCAEAQGDGVPCTVLGRECETCSMAVKAMYDLRATAEHDQAIPECGP